MSRPSFGNISILLIISYTFNPTFSVLHNYTQQIEKIGITQKKTRCLRVVAANFFLSSKNLYVVGDKDEDNQIYRFLYKDVSVVRESTAIFESKPDKRYVIIEDDIPLLTYMFRKPNFSTWSEYVILMKTSYENLSRLADYLYSLKYFHVAFLLVDDADDVTVYQFNARPTYENEGILVEVANCDDYFLTNFRDAQKSIRKFGHQILCPISGCDLHFWKIITDDIPDSIVYKIYENGTSFTDNIGSRMIRLFLEHHKIQMTKKPNDSNIDISWKSAVKAVLNGSVDILNGFIMPKPEDVEPLEIIVSFGSAYVGMMYVPKIKSNLYTRIENLFAPLQIEIWLYLIIVLLFYGLFIYAVKKIHEQHLIREPLHASDLVRIFLKQDIVPPTNGGLRIVVGIIFVFAFLLTMFYESAITSSFIVNVPQVRLETLQDLVESGHRFGGPKYIRRFFNDSSSPILKYIYDRYEIAETEKIMQMMHNEGVVMMHHKDVIDKFRLSIPQNFSYYISKKPVIGYPNLLFTNKGHPYTYFVKRLVLHLYGSGIISKWKKIFVIRDVQRYKSNKFSPLTHEQFNFCWGFLFIGWIISFTIFLAESIARRLK